MLQKFTSWLYLRHFSTKILFVVITLICFIFYPDLFISNSSRLYFYELFDHWFVANSIFFLRVFVWLIVLYLFYSFFLKKNGKYILNTILFFKKILHKYYRIALVLVVGLIEFYLLYSLKDELINFFTPIDNHNNVWLGSLLVMLVASPIGFFIWIFRNEDKRNDLENTKLKIRQEDFHQIEEWATIIDEKNNALQIAAIYQLIQYLKGEYGDHFIRPSMEILRSLLSLWNINDSEVSSVAGKEVILPSYISAIHNIFKNNIKFFNDFDQLDICKKHNWIPLEGLDLKFIKLNTISPANSLNMPNSSFRHSDLTNLQFRGANLYNTNFSYSFLSMVDFYNAQLQCAKFNNTVIMNAYFDKASIRRSEFKSSNIRKTSYLEQDLSCSKFVNTNFRYSNFDYANFRNCFFNQADRDKKSSTLSFIMGPHIDFSDSNIYKSKFNHANFSFSVFENADFEGSTFVGAVFSLRDKELILEKAKFNGIDLKQAIFE